MEKGKAILEKANRLAKELKTWADLSNAIFDPIDGIIVRTFPSPKERSEFRKTIVYNKLHELVEKKIELTGLVSGAKPKKSGKFVVRLPSSLHVALEKEAENEGTSLNQLVLTKLAVQLNNLACGRLAGIIQAFGEVRDGYSVDRVIADPKMNRNFLRRCRGLGLSGMDYDLNWALMNARKRGELSHLPKTKRYTVKELDEFEYASELTVRFLQQKRSVSLDQIICDPDLAKEFDEYATRLAPGFSPLQYRWAALGLRKAGRLGKKAETVRRLPSLEMLGKITSLKPTKIPEVSGLYLFSSREERVFIGQTDNLRHRIERHMEVSESRGLPEWLWNAKKKPLHISITGLPDITRSIRQTMEILLVKRLKPLLNLPRVA